MIYIIEGVNVQILTAEEKRRKEKQISSQGTKKEYYTAKDSDNQKQTTWNVFSDKQKKEFDVFAKKYGENIQRQSDCNLPRTFFLLECVLIKNVRVMR